MTCITKEQVEAMALADRILVLEFGKIVHVGTLREFCRQTVNLFVTKLICPKKMNALARHGVDTSLIGDGGPAGRITIWSGRETQVGIGDRIGIVGSEDRLHFFDEACKAA